MLVILLTKVQIVCSSRIQSFDVLVPLLSKVLMLVPLLSKVLMLVPLLSKVLMLVPLLSGVIHPWQSSWSAGHSLMVHGSVCPGTSLLWPGLSLMTWPCHGKTDCHIASGSLIVATDMLWLSPGHSCSPSATSEASFSSPEIFQTSSQHLITHKE